MSGWDYQKDQDQYETSFQVPTFNIWFTHMLMLANIPNNTFMGEKFDAATDALMDLYWNEEEDALRLVT